QVAGFRAAPKRSRLRQRQKYSPLFALSPQNVRQGRIKLAGVGGVTICENLRWSASVRSTRPPRNVSDSWHPRSESNGGFPQAARRQGGLQACRSDRDLRQARPRARQRAATAIAEGGAPRMERASGQDAGFNRQALHGSGQ